MLSLLVAAVVLGAPATEIKVLELVPTDDIWVYPHASDPSQDAYLRVWGIGGASVAGKGEDLSEFSYSFLKWSLPELPKDAKLVGAKLIVVHVPNPEFTVDMLKQTPLEVRPMPSAFKEKGWQHSQADQFSPTAGAKAIFGSAYPEKIEKNDKPIAFQIDLLKGPNDFKSYLSDGAKRGDLALALTSAIDASTGRSSVIKLFSKDGPKESRPILRLTFDSN